MTPIFQGEVKEFLDNHPYLAEDEGTGGVGLLGSGGRVVQRGDEGLVGKLVGGRGGGRNAAHLLQRAGHGAKQPAQQTQADWSFNVVGGGGGKEERG